ncbi:MAG: YrhB family protein [Proteobacteria bacterium]|nr:YrhB family protein [Pseudomonadota bacterium]
MLTKEQAQQRVEKYLLDEVCENEGDFKIVESATVERDFGWVFVYDSAEYLETGDEMDRAVGNAPVLVDRRSGELHVTGTGRTVEEYIGLYEKYGTCHPD